MLSHDITRYVELHRAMGLKFRQQACLLRHYAAYAMARGDSCVVVETVLDWAREAPSTAQRQERLQVVRRFARHMQAENEGYEVPPARAFGRPKRRPRMPHIYTTEEITRLLGAAAQLTPKGSSRPATYVALFALISSTGLRISEALSLKIEDFSNDGLIIRNTKFRKTRLVPLHPTARRGLEAYLAHWSKRGGTDRSIFVSLRGTMLSYTTVSHVFLELSRSIGLRGGPGSPGPCIHDLRHTFAVRALEKCDGGSEKVSRHILALSTYLGHAHPSDTYWYLQATPKLMGGIARACEVLFGGGEA